VAVLSPDTLLLNWLFALPFCAALAAELFPRLALRTRSEREAQALARGPLPFGAVTCLMGLALSFRLLLTVSGDTKIAADYWWTRDLYHLRLGADSFSAVIVLAIYGLGLLIFVHMAGLPTADRAHHRAALLLTAQGCGIGVALSTDLILLVFLLHLMVLSLWSLVSLEAPREADRLLVTCHIGASLVLGSALLMWRQGGDTATAQLPLLLLSAGPSTLKLMALVALTGLLTIMPGVPGHGWLPRLARATPGTGLLSVTLLVLVATTVLLRILPGMLLLPTVPGLGSTSLVLGLVTLWWGAVRAWLDHDMRGRAAWLTVAQSGYLLIALAGAAGTTASPVFLEAASLHLMVTPLALLAIWLSTSAVLARVGTDSLAALSALFGQMPTAGLGLLAGGLSLAGVPPLAGFQVQRLLVSGALAGGNWALAVTLVLANALILFVVWDIFRRAFLRRELPPPVRPGTLALALPVSILVGALLLFGIWSQPLAQWSQLAAGSVLSLRPAP